MEKIIGLFYKWMFEALSLSRDNFYIKFLIEASAKVIYEMNLKFVVKLFLKLIN